MKKQNKKTVYIFIVKTESLPFEVSGHATVKAYINRV